MLTYNVIVAHFTFYTDVFFPLIITKLKSWISSYIYFESPNRIVVPPLKLTLKILKALAGNY